MLTTTNRPMGVPTVDAAVNASMRDVVGNKDDTHDGNSLAAWAHANADHIHKCMDVFPSGGAGVTVTASDSNPWTLGSFAVIVAADAIASDFDVHFLVIETMSANAIYELVLYSGADASEMEIAHARFVRVTNQVRSVHIPIQTPIVPANTQIKAKVMSSTGALDSITMSLAYHTY